MTRQRASHLRAVEGPLERDVCAGKGLLSVDVALAKGLALAEPLRETETLPLERATGRVLAERLIADAALPHFDNAAMDGYAIRRAMLCGPGPWRLSVKGRVAAGDRPRAMPLDGALRILTGAPVPAEADAVVMQEHVVRDEDGGAITLSERPPAGHNIRRAGEDVAPGDTILQAGRLIGPRETAALAALGMSEVRVVRRLRVAILATGSELVAPGAPLGPGQIYNSNRAMLAAALAEPFVDVVDLGALPDDPLRLVSALRRCAETADVIVTTGGVSVGDEDHMPAALRASGGTIHAMRIAMKPGKPLAIGTVGSAIYLGLPGNPVSAFITWHVIGRQIARQRAGLRSLAADTRVAAAGFTLERRPGRTEFRPASLEEAQGAALPTVRLLAPSFSARIGLLAAADGLAILPADTAAIAPGDALRVISL